MFMSSPFNNRTLTCIWTKKRPNGLVSTFQEPRAPVPQTNLTCASTNPGLGEKLGAIDQIILALYLLAGRLQDAFTRKRVTLGNTTGHLTWWIAVQHPGAYLVMQNFAEPTGRRY